MRRQTDATIKLDSLYIPPVQDVGMASMYVPGTHSKTKMNVDRRPFTFTLLLVKNNAFCYLQYFKFKFVLFNSKTRYNLITYYNEVTENEFKFFDMTSLQKSHFYCYAQ